MTRVMTSLLLGGGLGALLGRHGKCCSGSCLLTANPMRDMLAGPLKNQVKFVITHVGEAAALAQSLEIEAFPSLLFFKSGKVVNRSDGLLSEAGLTTHPESLGKRF